MPNRKTSVKTLRELVLVAIVALSTSNVQAQVAATWLPAGPSQNYSNGANWSGGVVPVNGLNGPDTYAVTIGSETVNFDLAGMGNQVSSLALAESAGLTVSSTRNLEVLGVASINGLLTVNGGSFTAANLGTTLSNGRVALTGSASAVIAATTYNNGRGTSETIFSSTGTGTVLDLSSLQSMTFGTLSTGTVYTKTIQASSGAVIDLSGLSSVSTISGDNNDALNFVMDGGGTIDLSNLQSINSATGNGGERVRFYYEAGQTYSLPKLVTARATEFYLRTGTTLNVDELTTIERNYSTISLGTDAAFNAPELTSMANATIGAGAGAAFNAPQLSNLSRVSLTIQPDYTFNTAQLTSINHSTIHVSGGMTFDRVIAPSYGNTVGVSETIFSSTGTGTVLDLSSLQSMTFGTLSTGTVYTKTIQASSGAVIDLSGLSSVSTISGDNNDALNFVMDGGGTIDLSNLQSINSATGNGGERVRFYVDGNGKLILGNVGIINRTELLLRTNSSRAAVTGSLNMASTSTLSVVQGAQLSIGGNLTLRQTAESQVSMTAGTLQMHGAGTQQLEVGGQDVGVSGTVATNSGNFGIGRLLVGSETQQSIVQLTDLVNNGNRNGPSGAAEALYLFGTSGLSGLQLFNDSTLVLNGINVYSWDAASSSSVHLNSLFAPGVLSIPFGEGRLQLLSGVGPFRWNASGSGVWSSGTNWTPSLIPNGDFKAVFAGGVGGPTTVTVNDDIQIGELQFNNSTHSYTIAGDGSHGLELVGASKIEVTAGTHTISAPLSGVNGLTKTGTGTLRLSGNSTYTGATQIQAGTVRASAPEHFGQSESIDVVSGATLDLTDAGLFQLGANRTLTGRGQVLANVLAVPDSSTLGGTMQITGNVVNAGSVAPGPLTGNTTPGIMTIIGNYSQQSSGALQMEVGGTVPGVQHDMLIVTGTASLSGRLDVELINGFVPQPGNEMQLLLAGSVVGKFDSQSVSPDLATVNPNVAVDVETTANTVKIKFVSPSFDNGFDGTAASTNWSDVNNWVTGVVPTRRDVITVENQSNVNQQLDVEELPILPNSQNAFTHELTIVGDAQTMAVTVQEGSSLSATVGVNVESRGIVELDGGSVATSTLAVEDGGTLKGSGEIFGNYSQASGGELAMTITNDADFDTLDISKSASLAGTLNITIPNNATIELGDSFEILTANDLLGTFDNLEISGDFGLSLGLDFEDGLIALSTFNTGNMNRSGPDEADEDDIPAFALALTNPSKYFNDFGASSDNAGDIDGDGDCDVDDIDNFKALLPNMSMAEFQYRMAHALSVPEPSSLLLSLLGLVVVFYRPNRL
jgi:autotransporter-associated beta strand protein